MPAFSDLECRNVLMLFLWVYFNMYIFKLFQALCVFLLNIKIHAIILSFLSRPLQIAPEENKEGMVAQNDMENGARGEKQDSPRSHLL